MKNILIADAGSTKTDWALLSPGGDVRRFRTEGLNALLATPKEMVQAFSSVNGFLAGPSQPFPSSTFPTISLSEMQAPVLVDEIHYYGAGCATEAICRKTQEALSEALNARNTFVSSDLLGAARALLGNEPGIACILGTGSNSCLYDGLDIVMNTPALGFILGDEGSGASLGKRLVGDVFKGLLPDALRRKFQEKYHLTTADVLGRVYRQPNANRFLASLVPFISENISDPYLRSLVSSEFTGFLTRNVMRYPDTHSIPISFTGSIAMKFGEILHDTVSKAGLTIGKIVAAPMEGLIAYHSH